MVCVGLIAGGGGAGSPREKRTAHVELHINLKISFRIAQYRNYDIKMFNQHKMVVVYSYNVGNLRPTPFSDLLGGLVFS